MFIIHCEKYSPGTRKLSSKPTMDSSKWQCKYICKITEEELSWIAKIIVGLFKEILSNKASYYTFVFFLTYHVGMLMEYPEFLKDL